MENETQLLPQEQDAQEQNPEPKPSSQSSQSELTSGKVKFFDSKKGFGFIVRDDTGEEIFVHQSAIFAEGFRSLAEGEFVEFGIAQDPVKQKKFATNVTGPNGSFVLGNPRPIKMIRGYQQRSGGGYDHLHLYPDGQFDGRYEAGYGMSGQYGGMQYGPFAAPINGAHHFGIGGRVPMQYGFDGVPPYMPRRVSGGRDGGRGRRNEGEIYRNEMDQFGHRGPYGGQY